MRKIVYAGANASSFTQASALLLHLAERTIDPKQVERLTERIGTERVAQRDAQTIAFGNLPLADKFVLPQNGSAPPLAVVMVDGGRLQIRPTPPPVDAPEATTPTPPAATATVADEVAPNWEEQPPRSGHWREDKIALLLTLQSTPAATDPCPQVPAAFLDILRIPKLIRQFHKTVRTGEDAVAEADSPEDEAAALAERGVYKAPEVSTRQVLASRRSWPEFAPQVAAAAREQGFYGASRRAFVADGSSNNWTLHKRFFSSFEPILDFIHALTYVYAAARAGRTLAAGWVCYREWIGWVWAGEVSRVLEALRQRQEELQEAGAEETETSPLGVVKRTLGYLEHHADKMKYAEYRCAGLPVSSSLMESAVKQINQRVKGSEKFWSEGGSEAVLQLRADYLSDGALVEEFWDQRQAEATGQRPYRRSA